MAGSLLRRSPRSGDAAPAGGVAGVPRSTGRSLADRADTARGLLGPCRVCEVRCGADRRAGERGPCRLTDATYVYKRYASANEEWELLPALRLFLGACNFRCTFCDEAPLAFAPAAGERVDPPALARELEREVARGIRTISILGGEPSLHVHTLLAVAAAAKRPLPFALNSNMYMTPEVIELLSGVAQWYLADLKFGNDRCARSIAGIHDYNRIVRRNLRLAARQARIIIRHVLLPGHLTCCFRPLVRWLSDNMPAARLQLYTGYVPCGTAAGGNAELARLNTPAEIRGAKRLLRTTTLQWQTATGVPSVPVPPSRESVFADVTIGVDGRLYCHDLPYGLADALAVIAAPPGDGASGHPLPVLSRGGNR